MITPERNPAQKGRVSPAVAAYSAQTHRLEVVGITLTICARPEAATRFCSAFSGPSSGAAEAPASRTQSARSNEVGSIAGVGIRLELIELVFEIEMQGLLALSPG